MLGLNCFAWAFSSCGECGHSLVVVPSLPGPPPRVYCRVDGQKTAGGNMGGRNMEGKEEGEGAREKQTKDPLQTS